MRLGDKKGLICDYCGKHMLLVEKYEISYRRYLYDETLPIVKSTTTTTQLAYDLCEDCFEKVDRYLAKGNTVRPFHDPYALLRNRYEESTKKMQKILKSRQCKAVI